MNSFSFISAHRAEVSSKTIFHEKTILITMLTLPIIGMKKIFVNFANRFFLFILLQFRLRKQPIKTNYIPKQNKNTNLFVQNIEKLQKVTKVN